MEGGERFGGSVRKACRERGGGLRKKEEGEGESGQEEDKQEE